MYYYKLNNGKDNIYVEYSPFGNILYRWNCDTKIIKLDKVSEYVAQKLIANVLKPVCDAEMERIYHHTNWIKQPERGLVFMNII